MRRRWLALSFCLTLSLVGGLALPGAALGATITVTITADERAADGECSLREAISAANNDSTGPGDDCTKGASDDKIDVPAGDYMLTRDGVGENNNATGDLIFDSNGNAAGGATQFAKLAAGIAMTAVEFFVV